MRSDLRSIGVSRNATLAVTLGALLLTAIATAQPSGPIYPSYEGYLVNDDGTFTLFFGYFNSNPVDIEIEPGPGNSFTDAPHDRGQPTTFRPGHQRNVCRMVVDADFSGVPRWTLRWGGTSTTTTELGGINELYMIERIGSGASRVADLDTAVVERAVCLNRPPRILRGRRPLRAVSGEPAQLAGVVSDDGLPRGSTTRSSWSVVSGPGEVSFVDAANPTTEATFSAPGDYTLQLSASDSELSGSAEIEVTVTDSEPGDPGTARP